MKTRDIEYVVRENGCWECVSHKPGIIDRDGRPGFPKIMRNKRRITIARAMLEQWFQDNRRPLPESYEKLNICHSCGNKMCINPEHLFFSDRSHNATLLLEMVNNNKDKKVILHKDNPNGVWD